MLFRLFDDLDYLEDVATAALCDEEGYDPAIHSALLSLHHFRRTQHPLGEHRWNKFVAHLGWGEALLRWNFRRWLQKEYGPDPNVQEFCCHEERPVLWELFHG